MFCSQRPPVLHTRSTARLGMRRGGQFCDENQSKRQNVARMRPLILATTLLPLALAGQSGPVPATASDPVLDAVRRYVAHWRSTLPDFICQQSTLLFSGSHSDHIWHPTNNQQLESDCR